VSDSSEGHGWWLASDGKWYPPQPPVVPSASGTNGLAIASMVLGILGISIVAVILGHISLSQIKRSGDTQEGRGFAIAGLVLGYIGLAVFLILIAIVVVVAVVCSGGDQVCN
jgi:hypothetical protein